jgi:hypothetical protein
MKLLIVNFEVSSPLIVAWGVGVSDLEDGSRG